MNQQLAAARRELCRRQFLTQGGVSLGAAALAAQLAKEAAAAPRAAGPPRSDPLAPREGHFPPRAKNVIYLFMAGGPSHLELFDPKPKLQQLNGQVIPESYVKNKRFAFLKRDSKLLGTRRRFQRHGQSGAELSELLPHLARVVDDIAIVRSMQTDVFNHGPAKLMANTGAPQFSGRPSMGSWVTYGIGAEADDLPGYVVLQSGGRGPRGGSALWASGFLPTTFQGVPFLPGPQPILNLASPAGITARRQRQFVDAVGQLNRARLETSGDPEVNTRIANYEMAFRMQSSAPELTDLNRETPETLALYGAKPGVKSFANNCLLARRMIERGVRFVQLYHTDWDHHATLDKDLDARCQETDQASAALLIDLKRRGLLDDTLVLWGGEFGRTPMGEDRSGKLGRDHHIDGYSMWLAGGGIRGGQTLGATDDLGFYAVEDPVHVHDLQATILHLLGLDHLRLTYRFQGRDFRLTDVGGRLVEPLLA